MRITTATIEHLDQLSVLFDAYRMFYRKPTDRDGARLFLKERMENNESIIFLVVDDDGTVAGFTQLYPLFSSTRMKRWWLLNDLFVKTEFRGQDLSKLLIERCKALAMETKAAGLSLETEISNHIGNRLYPEAGFELDTEHNFYFWENNIW
ncbi:MAG TPA: GNAT family N-acetyltransferase [Chitinophagales bacterium]|nr:GNAT family N-acetyltransferase [Chitinophagales bacterium]